VYLFLLSVLVLDAFLLIAVVLLQAGKGGGLAAMGAAGAGTDSLFGSRQTATLLTKATWWAGGLFLVLAFALSLMGPGTRQAESILREGVAPVTAPAPKATLPGPAAPATQGTESAPTTPGAGTAPAAPK
jgi:preprotein translocase subunit SecG